MITLLAVVEHIPVSHMKEFLACGRVLKPDGRIVITVPSRETDFILKFLHFGGIIDGMALEQHHGFLPKELPNLLIDYGLEIVTWNKFQLDLIISLLFKNLRWPMEKLLPLKLPVYFDGRINPKCAPKANYLFSL